MDKSGLQQADRACHLTLPILYTKSLSIGYQTKGNALKLEENLDVEICNGELVCLIGPNGCGKSTLMRTIAGLQQPLAGKTFISEVNLKKLPPHKYAKLLSLVLTDKINARSLTVHDIVSIGRYPYLNYFAKLTKKDNTIISQSIEQVHLEQYTHTFFDELSDGEKQRVLLAKALAQDTPLIMLDEPTAHLDLPNRVEIMNLLKHLAKDTNKAILLSTHELDLALQTSDTIWLMSRETKLQRGTPEDLVLNGAFEHVFRGKAFDFDKFTGSFKIKHMGKGEIGLVGEGLQFIWTKRALEREGYVVTAKGNNIVQCYGNYWQIIVSGNSKKCNNIAELLTHLRYEAYCGDPQMVETGDNIETGAYINLTLANII